ncbi:unnamed protein product [Brassicogethes aeneus]|uniref:THAP-type domain-containing protein n=1 Tax=Brassicogethes aeneus TaxID=1431903 RepID=A0A9P0AWZ2_BRAAE|nr:unnamed protein product [Brassicogethes aeneus]
MDLFNQWVKLCQNKRLFETTPEKVFKNCRVCSKHFAEKDFIANRRLNRQAYPTKLLPEGKALALSRDCKFIETSSGIQHNVDELLVGILKQIRLREFREKKKSGLKRENHKLHGSKTSLSLNIAREILQKICMNDISKSKSCENLHVL